MRIWFLLLVLLVTLVPTVPAEAAADVAWNVACPISHFGGDDPIVHPGHTGSSHMHAFYGNTTTNAQTTTASLLAAPSTCEKGFAGVDHSAYWIPALYRKLPGDQLQQISGTTKDLRMTIYYRRTGGTDGDKVQPFPQGLRMIAGDGEATAPQNTEIVAWRCYSSSGGFTPRVAAVPTCNSQQYLMAIIRYPNCWNGKDLDSTDHKSHMAYSSGKTASCPASHPIKLPQVTFEASYKAVNGNGSQYELSSGGQYSLHGDFFAGWDPKVQSALVNSCVNVGKKCTGIKLAEVDLASATRDSGSGAVLAASTVSPSPSPRASALPAAGPATAMSSTLGLLFIGYAYHSFRVRKRNLLDALQRKRSHTGQK